MYNLKKENLNKFLPMLKYIKIIFFVYLLFFYLDCLQCIYVSVLLYLVCNFIIYFA